VDDAIVSEHRSPQIVQQREGPGGSVLQHGGEQDVGVGRAARNVDDRFVAHDRRNPDRIGRVVRRRRDPPPRCARTDRDHRGGVGRHPLEQVDAVLAGDLEIDAAVLSRDRALDDQHVLAGVFAHRLMQRRLGLVTGADHQGLVIIERDQVQNQLGEVGGRGSQQRLTASGAVLHVQPDDRGPPRSGDLARHLRSARLVGPGDAGRRDDRELETEAKKSAAADSAAHEVLADGLVMHERLLPCGVSGRPPRGGGDRALESPSRREARRARRPIGRSRRPSSPRLGSRAAPA